MKKSILIVASLMLAGLMANAQDVFVFPAKGQSAEQTEKDKFECYQWAKQQTGFDPVAGATASAPAQPAKQERDLVKGAARGAAVGAVAGAIAGDAGKGAAAGAAGGALLGGFKKVDKKRAQAEQQQQKQTAVNEKQSTYNRAYQACLEGKGYTVK